MASRAAEDRDAGATTKRNTAVLHQVVPLCAEEDRPPRKEPAEVVGEVAPKGAVGEKTLACEAVVGDHLEASPSRRPHGPSKSIGAFLLCMLKGSDQEGGLPNMMEGVVNKRASTSKLLGRAVEPFPWR